MRIGIIRIGIGLLQGIALAALWPAYQALGGMRPPSITWEAFRVVVPLVFALLFAPVAVSLALGRLRWPLLAVWAGAVAFISAGAGLNIAYGEKEYLALESLLTWPALLVVVLAGQSLLVAWDTARTPGGAFYPTCFDATWRHVLALTFATGLVWVFWLVLGLADELAGNKGSHLVSLLPDEHYFYACVTTVVFAVGLHVVDTYEELTRKVRGLLLGALSVLALILLVPVWQEGARLLTPALLMLAVLLIMLINLVYREGADRRLRSAGFVAVLLLAALALAAGFTLPLLRLRHPSVHQPWMIEHVYAVAITGIVAVYAVGYLFAVRRCGLHAKVLGRVNIGGAFVTMAVLLALNTPVFDPARISAGLQVARFHLGRVQPDQSDGWYRYMGQGVGRYGRDELQLLARYSFGPDAGEIAQRAQWAWTDATRDRLARNAAGVLLPPERRAHNITVVSADGAALPGDFLQLQLQLRDQASWYVRGLLRDCFTTELDACLAVVLNHEQHGRQGILLISRRFATLFMQDDAGIWYGGENVMDSQCPGVRTILAGGPGQPAPPLFPDAAAAGVRLRLWRAEDCR